MTTKKLKVALVRGRYLNKYEMQFYEPLASKYDLAGFGSITSYHTHFNFPVAKLLTPVDILDTTNKIGIPQKLTIGILNRMFIDAHFLFGLEDRLKNFDIAHTADTFYHFTHQCILAKRKGYVKKVVATVFENIPFNNEGIWGRKEFKETVLKEVDHFFAISKRSKEALLYEGCPEDKISVVTQAIDTSLFIPPPAKNTRDNKMTILFCGRLEWYKGVFDILYAAYKLVKDKSLSEYQLHFIFIGNGSERKRLEQLEKRLGIAHMISHKSVSYDKMPGVYQEADIFIAPSKETPYWQEQFSTVLLEAQSSGLPIVTTKTGGIPENVGDAAIMVGVGDIDGLAEGLKKLIISEKLRLDLGKKARNRAVKYFDIEIIAKKIDRIYESLFE